MQSYQVTNNIHTQANRKLAKTQETMKPSLRFLTVRQSSWLKVSQNEWISPGICKASGVMIHRCVCVSDYNWWMERLVICNRATLSCESERKAWRFPRRNCIGGAGVGLGLMKHFMSSSTSRLIVRDLAEAKSGHTSDNFPLGINKVYLSFYLSFYHTCGLNILQASLHVVL